MPWFNWVSRVICFSVIAAWAQPAMTACLGRNIERNLSSEQIEIYCSGLAMMPFTVQHRYFDDGGYNAYASAPKNAGRNKTEQQVGLLTNTATPVPTHDRARAMIRHFERRTGCVSDQVRYAADRPTFFRLICSTADEF